MKKLLAILVLIAILPQPLPAEAAALDTESRAVVQLQTATKKGTGFYISESGYLLTNFHVIDGASSVKVCTQADSQAETSCDQSAVVIAEDPDSDVALLRLENPRKIARPFLTLGDSDTLSLNDQIRLFGYPDSGGNALTISSGKVIGWFEGREFVKVDAALSHGSSGGAMLSDKGIAMGMTMAILKERDADSGLIIPMNRVKDWLSSIGFGDAALLGESIEALTQSKIALEERLKKYQVLTRAQKVAYEEITQKYDALRATEEENYEDALKKIERNAQTERVKVDDYLASLTGRITEAEYLAEVERVEGLWNEFADRIEEQKGRLESAYEYNIKIYDQLEAVALEQAGVVDYTARIQELHSTLEEVKRKISRTKMQEAAKKRIATPSLLPTKKPDAADARDETESLPYENFGSMRPEQVGDWLLRSVGYRKNGIDFAFIFWNFSSPNSLGTTMDIEAIITDMDSGESMTPIIIRKKFLLFRFVPGTKYRFDMTAKSKSGEALETLRFETTTL